MATVVLGCLWVIWRLNSPGASPLTGEKPAASVNASKAVSEASFNTITLKPSEAQRIAVQSAPVEQKSIPLTRDYGGEVMIPTGRAILVAAPVGGLLKAPVEGIPRVGQTVKQGEVIFQLLPLLTPEGRTALESARVDAEGQVKNAQVQLDAARIALDRAKNLLRDQAGSKRMVDEAQALYDGTQKTHEAVTARRDLLVKTLGDTASGTAVPLSIAAPEDGQLRNIAALPNQTVPTGAALFEIINARQVWIRVPVYVGEHDEIDPEADAALGKLSAKTNSRGIVAKPVAAPPSANSLASTVDLFYQAENEGLALIPGQRVGITIPLRGERPSLVIPWSAVVYDIHGGSWVYEELAPLSYVRRRVVVRSVIEDQAVLVGGPAAGTRLVVTGAQEIFGKETGFSK